MRSAMPGVQSVDALRAQLLRSTAAQREEEQKDRCVRMKCKGWAAAETYCI